jgi:hypothetical protein
MNRQLVIPAENSFIGAWFIEDMSLCDDMIHHFENSSNKLDGVVLSNGQLIVDKLEKASTDLKLDPADAIAKRYIQELQKVLEMYKTKYVRSDNVDKFGIEAINLQKYDPTGGYRTWHAERSDGYSPNVYRHLVFMTYLNTVSDEGETEFFYQKLKVKPQKGLTLIWPADWTHTHRGIPSMTQTKYIATGWYTFVNRTPDKETLVDKNI